MNPTFSVENLQKAVDNSGYELIAQEGKTQTFAIEGLFRKHVAYLGFKLLPILYNRRR